MRCSEEAHATNLIALVLGRAAGLTHMNRQTKNIDLGVHVIGATLDRIRQDGTIVVVHGGDPKVAGTVLHETFNPRATKSYAQVGSDIAGALRRNGFRNVHVIADGLQLTSELQALRADFVWVNSGGVQGYNAASHTPAMLELMGLPYVGHDPLNVSLLDNKHVFKHLMCSLGVPTSPFLTWNGVTPPDLDSLRCALGAEGPYIAKPVAGRASNHVIAVDHLAELPNVMRHIHEVTLNAVLVERYLPGAEYAVAVYGGVRARHGEIIIHDEPTVFSPIQRVLEPGERVFTSMDVKPITEARLRLLAPDDPVRDELSQLARAVYSGVNLNTLVRLDVRADADGKCFVLEANPKPDLKAPDEHSTNIVSIGLAEIGMTYDDLILSLFVDRLFHYATIRRYAAPNLARFLECSTP